MKCWWVSMSLQKYSFYFIQWHAPLSQGQSQPQTTWRWPGHTCACQGPASPVDIKNTAFQRLFGLWRAFKHSDFHAVKVSVRHLHLSGWPRAFLAERNDDKIQCKQMVAQAQVVDQVTLQGEAGNEEGERRSTWSSLEPYSTHQLLEFKSLQATATALEDSLATFNAITNCIYLLLLEPIEYFQALNSLWFSRSVLRRKWDRYHQAHLIRKA